MSGQFNPLDHGCPPQLMWDKPNAYLVPFVPESATFLRLSDRWGLARDAPMWMRVRDRVSQTRSDDLFFLETGSQVDMEAKRRALLELGYQLDVLRCQWIPSVTLVHRICGVRQWTQEASGAISIVSYGAAYQASAFAVAPGATLTVPVIVTNTGSLPWDAYGALRLAYHWYNGSTLITWDGLRTPLPLRFFPEESLTLQASVKAPASAGTYILSWDMVQEFVTWFSIQGVATKNLAIVVS
jgi:hypothetical protein